MPWRACPIAHSFFSIGFLPEHNELTSFSLIHKQVLLRSFFLPSAEQESDIAGFKETIWLDVRHMRSQMKHAELAPGHISDTDDRCCRGIEHFAMRDSLMRQDTAKNAVIASVLREQEHLSGNMPSLDSHDAKHKNIRADAIAQAVCDVSMRLSLEARCRAANVGASDRAFVAAEEAGLRALLASHNFAHHTAQTDLTLAATRGYARSASSPLQPTTGSSAVGRRGYTRSASSIQPSTGSKALVGRRSYTRSTSSGQPSDHSKVEPSSSSFCLKRSACSVPNMINYASNSLPTPAMFQSYEKFAEERRRRRSQMRENLLASMTVLDYDETPSS